MKLQAAVKLAKIGTILLVLQSAITFFFQLYDLSTLQNYLTILGTLLQVIGFTFLYIFLYKFHQKVTRIYK
jgi:hypothetical protein